jgi:hypothetical protein
MAMTEKEQRDLRSYCAFILKEYGFDIPPNDPVIPALYVIHKEMQFNNESNQVIASLVKEAASKINPTVFHFCRSSIQISVGHRGQMDLKWAFGFVVHSSGHLVLVTGE